MVRKSRKNEKTGPLSDQEVIERLKKIEGVISGMADDQNVAIEVDTAHQLERINQEVIERKKMEDEDLEASKEETRADTFRIYKQLEHDALIKLQNARRDLVEDVRNEAREKLKEKMPEKLEEGMELMILQSLTMLNEEKVLVQVRKCDEQKVEAMLSGIEKKYTQMTKSPVKLKMHPENLKDNDDCRVICYDETQQIYVDKNLKDDVSVVSKTLFAPSVMAKAPRVTKEELDKAGVHSEMKPKTRKVRQTKTFQYIDQEEPSEETSKTRGSLSTDVGSEITKRTLSDSEKLGGAQPVAVASTSKKPDSVEKSIDSIGSASDISTMSEYTEVPEPLPKYPQLAEQTDESFETSKTTMVTPEAMVAGGVPPEMKKESSDLTEEEMKSFIAPLVTAAVGEPSENGKESPVKDSSLGAKETLPLPVEVGEPSTMRDDASKIKMKEDSFDSSGEIESVVAPVPVDVGKHSQSREKSFDELKRTGTTPSEEAIPASGYAKIPEEDTLEAEEGPSEMREGSLDSTVAIKPTVVPVPVAAGEPSKSREKSIDKTKMEDPPWVSKTTIPSEEAIPASSYTKIPKEEELLATEEGPSNVKRDSSQSTGEAEPTVVPVPVAAGEPSKSREKSIDKTKMEDLPWVSKTTIPSEEAIPASSYTKIPKEEESLAAEEGPSNVKRDSSQSTGEAEPTVVPVPVAAGEPSKSREKSIDKTKMEDPPWVSNTTIPSEEAIVASSYTKIPKEEGATKDSSKEKEDSFDSTREIKSPVVPIAAVDVGEPSRLRRESSDWGDVDFGVTESPTHGAKPAVLSRESLLSEKDMKAVPTTIEAVPSPTYVGEPSEIRRESMHSADEIKTPSEVEVVQSPTHAGEPSEKRRESMHSDDEIKTPSEIEVVPSPHAGEPSEMRRESLRSPDEPFKVASVIEAVAPAGPEYIGEPSETRKESFGSVEEGKVSPEMKEAPPVPVSLGEPSGIKKESAIVESDEIPTVPLTSDKMSEAGSAISEKTVAKDIEDKSSQTSVEKPKSLEDRSSQTSLQESKEWIPPVIAAGKSTGTVEQASAREPKAVPKIDPSEEWVPPVLAKSQIEEKKPTSKASPTVGESEEENLKTAKSHISVVNSTAPIRPSPEDIQEQEPPPKQAKNVAEEPTKTDHLKNEPIVSPGTVKENEPRDKATVGPEPAGVLKRHSAQSAGSQPEIPKKVKIMTPELSEISEQSTRSISEPPRKPVVTPGPAKAGTSRERKAAEDTKRPDVPRGERDSIDDYVPWDPSLSGLAFSSLLHPPPNTPRARVRISRRRSHPPPTTPPSPQNPPPSNPSGNIQ